jgi:predicted nucleic acid-binding protein
VVLVDTPVWSLALRRKLFRPQDDALREQLAQLARRGEAHLLGVVRQELLSGVRDREQFTKLRDYLRKFPDVPLATEDYERAGEMSNRLRSAGIAGSPVDILLCAAAVGRNWRVFSTDTDFTQYARVLPIKLLPNV